MPVHIHNKEYYTVAERLTLVHKSGKVFQVIESLPVQAGDSWVWKATIMIEDRVYVGNAWVKLNARAGSPDATDPWACGETSAIGRALAFAGFSGGETIASADELGDVAEAQQSKRPALKVVEPEQPTSEITAPVPSKLRKMFVSIGTTLETAEKLTFKVVKNDLELSPEECFTLHQVYDVWKKRHDEKQAAKEA